MLPKFVAKTHLKPIRITHFFCTQRYEWAVSVFLFAVLCNIIFLLFTRFFQVVGCPLITVLNIMKSSRNLSLFALKWCYFIFISIEMIARACFCVCVATIVSMCVKRTHLFLPFAPLVNNFCNLTRSSVWVFFPSFEKIEWKSILWWCCFIVCAAVTVSPYRLTIVSIQTNRSLYT